MNIGIATQTPPIRFRLTYRELIDKYGQLDLPLNLSSIDQGDYYYSVGGVTRMVMMLSRALGKKYWVSLGPGYPPQVTLGDILVEFVDLPPDVLRSYTTFKEAIYNESHGLERYRVKGRDYLGYLEFNMEVTKALLKYYDDVDVYFVNDFQLALVGSMIGPSAPVVYWHHIPFVPKLLGDDMREFLLRSFQGNDRVVFSTRRDLEGVAGTQYAIRAKQIYPFIDPKDYRRPSRAEVERVREKFGIPEGKRVVSVVARLDPIKSQDVAIRAISRVEDAVLLIVGDGSFTSQALATGKGGKWLNHLKQTAKELKVEDRVIFTGYVTDEELSAIYELTDVNLLPSNIEGFGLTVCEGWVYGKPAVVSSGAGVSELVIDGVNGYVFRAGNHEDLGEKIKSVLKKEDLTPSVNLRQCSAEVGVERLKSVLEEAIQEYR